MTEEREATDYFLTKGYNAAIIDIAEMILTDYLGTQNDPNTDILLRKLREQVLSKANIQVWKCASKEEVETATKITMERYKEVLTALATM